MGKFGRFMKENKIQRVNTHYAATRSLVDENGEPLKWEIKPITTKENEALRDACVDEIPIKGKSGAYKPRLNMSKYIAKLICTSVVEPNLYDKELQDSYGVTTPEELVQVMVDDPGEYQDFANFVQNYNGFKTELEDKVEEAKN